MKTPLRLAGLLAALVVASWSPSSMAADAQGMAEKGQLFVSADRLIPFLGYTRTSIESEDPNQTTTSTQSGVGLSLLTSSDLSIPGAMNPHTLPRPAVDLTVIPNLTVGLAIPIGFGFGGSREVEVKQGGQTNTQEGDGPSATVFGIVPRVGYILPLNDFLAFWPRGGLAFYSMSTTTETSEGNQTQKNTLRSSVFALDLDPQLAIVPTEHFFISVGPLVNIPLTGSLTRKVEAGSTTTERSDDRSDFHIGLSASIGGWFGPLW